MAVIERSSFSVLRHRAFRLFWVGNLISGCGIWVQNLALGWLIVKLTDAPMRLGVFGFASLIPTLLFAMFGGTLADRVNRRTILIVTQSALMLLALALSALTHAHVIKYWHILLTAVLTGAAVAVNSPAYQAIIPDLVPAADLTDAIALNSVQFNVARIVGHAAAGILVVAVGEAGCFLLNALSYVAMLYALCRISVSSGHRRNDSTSFFARTAEGIRYLRTNPVLPGLIATVGCISLLGLPYFFLLPGFARDVLHVDARRLGYLTASVSAGGLGGGLLLRAIAARYDKRVIVAAAGLLFWIVLFAFALSRSYWLSLCLLMVLGFALVLTISTVNNLLQVSTPPEMRGRVMSIHGVALNGLAPLGSLLAGALAQRTSLSAAVATLAVTGVLATGLGLIRPREVPCPANQ